MLPAYFCLWEGTLGVDLKQERKEEVVVSVYRMRPSKILPSLEGLLPEAKDSLVADDRKGTIRAFTTKSEADLLRSLVPLFDVQPRLINAEILLDSPADHLTTRTTVQLVNNQEWTFNDANLGMEMSVAERINEDGTMSAYVKSSYKGSAIKVVVRLKRGESLYVRPGACTMVAQNLNIARADKAFSKDLKKWDEACIPIITVRSNVAPVPEAVEFKSTP